MAPVSGTCVMGVSNRRSQEFVLGGDDNQGAEGVDGKGLRRGTPPPQPTRRPGERRKLPRPKTSFEVFRALKNKTHPIATNLSYLTFLQHNLVTFTFTITRPKHKTFKYILIPFAQQKRLCKFFPLPLGSPSPPLTTPMVLVDGCSWSISKLLNRVDVLPMLYCSSFLLVFGLFL